MAEIVIGRLIVEHRMGEDGFSYVWLSDKTEDITGRGLSNVEAVGMLEVAKALALSDLAVEDGSD